MSKDIRIALIMATVMVACIFMALHADATDGIDGTLSNVDEKTAQFIGLDNIDATITIYSTPPVETEDDSVSLPEGRYAYTIEATGYIIPEGEIDLTMGHCVVDVKGIKLVAPDVDVSPVFKTITEGDSVTFTATASHILGYNENKGVTLRYQWYNEDGQPIADATERTFTTSVAGSFYVVVTAESNIKNWLYSDCGEVSVSECKIATRFCTT